MKNLEKLVHKSVGAIAGTNAKAVKNSQRLREDLSLDSIRLVMLFTNLCDELNISLLEFDDADLVKVDTVGSVIDLFNQKQ